MVERHPGRSFIVVTVIVVGTIALLSISIAGIFVG